MPFQDKLTSDERQQMIAEAAYFRAERRGFAGGDSVRDWCEAEAEIDARLRQIQHAEYAAKIEEALETASKKLAAVRRKAAGLSADARAEWQKDVDKLAVLRDALKPKLAELRERGERAGQKLREQSERIREEIADLLRRLEAKTKH
jgi:predicted  nucleic acid-binding Zn-ribbon protein